MHRCLCGHSTTSRPKFSLVWPKWATEYPAHTAAVPGHTGPHRATDMLRRYNEGDKPWPWHAGSITAAQIWICCKPSSGLRGCRAMHWRGGWAIPRARRKRWGGGCWGGGVAYSKRKAKAMVAALLDEGVLDEVGLQESSGGRRAETLRLSESLGAVLGVDMDATSMQLALMRPDMAVLARQCETIDVRRGPGVIL